MASGFVPRDDLLTNFRTSRSVTAGAVFANNVVVTLPYTPTASNVNATYLLEPSNGKTIYRFSNKFGLPNVATSPTITLNISSDKSVVGDEIAVVTQMATNSTPGWNCQIFFAPVNDENSPWYVTSCGGVHYGYAIAPTSNQRWIQVFMFDGEKWVNTLDNC